MDNILDPLKAPFSSEAAAKTTAAKIAVVYAGSSAYVQATTRYASMMDDLDAPASRPRQLGYVVRLR